MDRDQSIRVGRLLTELSGQNLTFLARAPVVRLGEPLTERLILGLDESSGRTEALQTARRAAHDASWPLLAEVMTLESLRGGQRRLRAACDLFAQMGQGRLRILAAAGGGAAQGLDLYETQPWVRDDDPQPIRHHPVDPFATGFSAAAAEVALQIEPHSMLGRETECRAMGHPSCRFELDPVDHATGGTSDPLPEAVDLEAVERRMAHSFSGQDEDRINSLAAAFSGLIARVHADDPDLARTFGQRMPLELSSYRLQALFTTIHRIEHRGPEVRRDAERRLGRAVRAGAISTFRAVLESQAWRDLAGGKPKHIEDSLAQLCALARGLGMGRWVLHAAKPFSRIVLRAPTTLEAPFYLKRYGQSRHPRCLLFAHCAQAAVDLAHRHGSQQPETGEDWQVEETRCLSQGDELCEVTIRIASD